MYNPHSMAIQPGILPHDTLSLILTHPTLRQFSNRLFLVSSNETWTSDPDLKCLATRFWLYKLKEAFNTTEEMRQALHVPD